MHRLTTRLVSLGALAGALLLACTDPGTAPKRRSLPPRPGLAVVDLDTVPLPQAPSNLTATVTGEIHGDGWSKFSIVVTWMDNSDFVDEGVTMFHFSADTGRIMSLAAYAYNYDAPPGSTGERAATVLLPSHPGPITVTAQTARMVAWPSGGKATFWSAPSAAVELATLTTTSTKRRGKR